MIARPHHVGFALALFALPSAGCCDRDALDYAPVERDDWPTSTPEAEGLDPDLLDDLYCRAQRQDTLYGLLVAKNGKLVAEKYWGPGGIDERSMLQSATKSYYSALVGLALEQGCFSSLDQTFVDVFPELRPDLDDPRKEEITIRQLLQMRSGLPWEETSPAMWDRYLEGDHLEHFLEFDLVADPGEEMHYSNLTSYMLGAAVQRACGTDLRDFADAHLLGPLDAELVDWEKDEFDNYYPLQRSTARDMAKFGQLYLDEGEWLGERVLPAAWVEDSRAVYSGHAWDVWIGRNFRDLTYGYQWWSGRAGKHFVDFAWGHGGQLILLHEDHDLVVVTLADPFWLEHTDKSWRHESSILRMVGDFVASLPPA